MEKQIEELERRIEELKNKINEPDDPVNEADAAGIDATTPPVNDPNLVPVEADSASAMSAAVAATMIFTLF